MQVRNVSSGRRRNPKVVKNTIKQAFFFVSVICYSLVFEHFYLCYFIQKTINTRNFDFFAYKITNIFAEQEQKQSIDSKKTNSQKRFDIIQIIQKTGVIYEKTSVK